MKLHRVAISVAATTALVLGAAAAPALADGHTNTVNLHGPHVGSTAEGFEEQDCADEKFAGRADDEDAWHFVLRGQGSFESLTLTFSTPGGNVVATIVSKDSNNPSSGNGWRGYIDPAGDSGSDKHAYVFTDAGWTLAGGTAEAVDNNLDVFNLSHTCPGEADDEKEKKKKKKKKRDRDRDKDKTPPPPDDDDENGDDDKNGKDEDEKKPVSVPTAVPAGHGDTGSGVTGTVGLIAALAALTAAAAAGAMLIRRRFGHES